MTKDIDGINFDNLKIVYKAGDIYVPIKDVKPIAGGDAVTLEHKKGEIWFIDFWATWCPPC